MLLLNFIFKKFENKEKDFSSYQFIWEDVVYTLKMPLGWLNIPLKMNEQIYSKAGWVNTYFTGVYSLIVITKQNTEFAAVYSTDFF